MKRCTPMPCRPIALSMPDGVSTIRGGGCPSRSGEEQPLDRDAAERGEVDGVGVLDAVAEAAAGGDQRIGEPQRADRDRQIHVRRQRAQCVSASQTMRLRVEDRAVDARADEVRGGAGWSRVSTTQL